MACDGKSVPDRNVQAKVKRSRPSGDKFRAGGYIQRSPQLFAAKECQKRVRLCFAWVLGKMRPFEPVRPGNFLVAIFVP
jgi:hypothetical protein